MSREIRSTRVWAGSAMIAPTVVAKMMRCWIPGGEDCPLAGSGQGEQRVDKVDASVVLNPERLGNRRGRVVTPAGNLGGVSCAVSVLRGSNFLRCAEIGDVAASSLWLISRLVWSASCGQMEVLKMSYSLTTTDNDVIDPPRRGPDGRFY